jgi:hypothetical protein
LVKIQQYLERTVTNLSQIGPSRHELHRLLAL